MFIISKKMNKDLSEKGFLIIKGVYSKNEIESMRELCLEFFKKGGGFANAGGYARPAWVEDSSFKKLLEIYNMEKIKEIVSNCAGEKVSFIGHSDLHLNRTVGWHKDQLNGEARKFQKRSPWDVVDGETMKIYKVNLYLQDHSLNQDALSVRIGSHKFSDMKSGAVEHTKPALGDVLLFDQRITHRGGWSGNYDRVLICTGFGVKNCFFEDFKRGTEYRQNKQNFRNKK